MGKDVKFDIKAQNKTDAAFRTVSGNLSSLKSGLGTITKIAGGIAVAGGAAAAGIGYGVKTSLTHFAEYETALVDMGKVTKESLSSIESKIRDLPPELGTSTELVKGYYQVISAGVTDPVKAMDVLTTSARAAGAAHMEQSEVIKGITKLMAGYQGEITSASEAADILFTIEKQGQTSFQELIPVIGGLAAMAHNLGISQDELGGSFATVTQTAGSTEQAATQVQAVMTALQKPTTSMTEALNQMGYESAQSAIEQIGLTGTLKGLIASTGGSAVEMTKLFSRVEAVKGVTALAGNNFGTLTGNIEGMTEKTGAADRAWVDYEGTLAAVWDTFKNSVGNQVIILGQELAPKIKIIIEKVSDWIEGNKDLIKTGIVKFAKGFGDALSAAWPFLLGTWQAIVNIVGPTDTWGQKLKKVFDTIKTYIKPLKTMWTILKNIFYYVGTGIGRGLAAIVTTYEKVTGSFQTGTGLKGLPESGLYYGHKGEIVIDPMASAQIRAATRASYQGGNERSGNLNKGMGTQVIKKEYQNVFNITISPQYMTGDRNTARAVAEDIRREINRLNVRWGTA